MRGLRRNQQVVFYKLYEGQEEITDVWGNPTGNYVPVYGELQSAFLCVAPNKGTSETEQFGSFEDYDRTMTTADTSIDIDENAVLWVDGADTDGPWNYIVKQVAPWKNSVSFAIQQVAVTEAKATMEAIAKAHEPVKLPEEDGDDAEDTVEPS